MIDGEDYVAVENIDGLWKAICFSLASLPRNLDPQEVPFLRGHMDMTQLELAQCLKVDSQTVARWEKGKTEIPGPADFALRFLALGSPVTQPESSKALQHILAFVRDLTGKDEEQAGSAVFMAENGNWHARTAA